MWGLGLLIVLLVVGYHGPRLRDRYRQRRAIMELMSDVRCGAMRGLKGVR